MKYLNEINETRICISLSIQKDVILIQLEPLWNGARSQRQRCPARHIVHTALSADGSHGCFPLLPGVHQVGPSMESPSLIKIHHEEETINGIYEFVFFFRNIKDVLSCFTDSPLPSPTFPEGGNPVLYGEEDNKVTKRAL